MDQSRSGICCGSKVWAIFIGFLQALTGGLGMLFVVLTYVEYETNSDDAKSKTIVRRVKDEEEGAYTQFLVEISFTLISSILSLFAGVILIVGVRLNKAKLIHIWLGIQIIYIVVLVLGGVTCLILGTYKELAFNIVQILFIFLCIWIVIVYRRELSYRNQYKEYEDDDDSDAK